MTDMHPGQPIEEAIGTPTEVVGRRASPLMGVVNKVIGLGGALVRGFSQTAAEVFSPGEIISRERMSPSVASEFLEAINDTRRDDYAPGKTSKPPKPV
jgi:hypothetical protein